MSDTTPIPALPFLKSCAAKHREAREAEVAAAADEALGSLGASLEQLMEGGNFPAAIKLLKGVDSLAKGEPAGSITPGSKAAETLSSLTAERDAAKAELDATKADLARERDASVDDSLAHKLAKAEAELAWERKADADGSLAHKLAKAETDLAKAKVLSENHKQLEEATKKLISLDTSKKTLGGSYKVAASDEEAQEHNTAVADIRKTLGVKAS